MVEHLELEDLKKITFNYLQEATKKPQQGQTTSSIHYRSWNEVKIIHHTMKPISEDPLGFLSQHHYLFIDLEDGQRLRFFTKSAPQSIPSRLKYMKEFGVFRKELSIYKDILPLLETIHHDSVSAKCYFAKDNCLVFEDLFMEGYRIVSGRDGLLDYKYMKSAVRLLAKLHAASLIWEEQAGKKFHELPNFMNILKENAYPKDVPDDHARRRNFRNALQVFQQFIRLIPKYNSKELERILKRFPSLMETIYELAQTSKKYRNVVSHGDLWSNNIMFRIPSNESRTNKDELIDSTSAIECRFVDFQLARYSPPILDLITLLTIPTTPKFRQEHLMELIEFYYESLGEFLKCHPTSFRLEEILPRSEFLESVKEYRVCGLIESLLFSHLTILPPQLTHSLTRSTDGFEDFFQRRRTEFCMQAFQEDSMYRQRLSEMLEELIDRYILEVVVGDGAVE